MAIGLARRIMAVCALMLGGALGLAAPGFAQDAPRSYVLATASEGGAYYPLGVALALLGTIHLQAAQGIGLEAVTSGGSVDNLRLLREGEAQLAIMQTAVTTWAYGGTGPFEAVEPQDDLRAITMLWPDFAHFLLRSDLAQTGTIDDLAGLEGLGFSMGPQGSGTELVNGAMFANYPFDFQSWLPVNQSFQDSVQAMTDRVIAGVNISAGAGAASASSLLGRMAEHVTLLSVTDEQAQRLDGGQGIVATGFIPAGTYAGIDEAIQTVTLPNFLAVTADVPEEDVYQITQIMFANLAYLCEVHQAACALSVDTALNGLPVPLHPGAERYFREIGVEIVNAPDPTTP